MKILLDENLPVKLRLEVSGGHELFSVRQLWWSGKKNGDLLQLMVSNHINLLVTLDKNLVHQNKIAKLPLAVIILNAKNSKIETLIPFVQKLNNVVDLGVKEGQTIIIDL